MKEKEKVFTPIKVGRYILPNRFVMAPMTRSRAQFDGTPGDMTAEYYSQRAELGLIITEATQPSDDGQGYMATPGIYTQDHIKAWQKITKSVHDKGSHIFIQMMHVGRISHPDNTPHNRQALAPSAIAPIDKIFTPSGLKEIPTPRAMTQEDISQTIADFVKSAQCAIQAGADGVEIHGANGYLISQFLSANANVRTDQYGGSIENRARFVIEVTRAVAQEIGADRTGIRLSPGTKLCGIEEGNEGPDLYRYLVSELNNMGLAYLHIMDNGNEALLQDIRKLWKGNLILNRPGRARDQIGKDISTGLADLESYGQMVLANPDFIKRLETNAPMNIADHNSYFGGTEIGYTDYPFLDAMKRTA